MGVPINNVPRRVVFAASGTGPYAFTFEILAATDIAVYRDDTLLTLTTDYTVSINSNGTGSITLTAAPTGATQIAIVGNRTIQRTTDFTTGGDFFANTVNQELDQQTIFAQQNAEGLSRALQAPQTDPTTIDMTLPRASVRANKTLAFDSSGNPTTGEIIGDYRGNWAAGTAYNKRDIVKDTSNDNVYFCQVAHTSTGSLPILSNPDVAKWALLLDAASAAADAAAAAASASAAASSASAASTSASNAASSASAASTSASNASTSASNAASSASAASSSASTASTAATNAGNSASAASTSATNAANSASAASTSATNASNSASSASTSASNASTSASNAANSASAASASATNASNSASAAASSASAAAGSASSAAAVYDDFDDRYLGAKTSNPSTDNDGNALITGALYFNSVANEMRAWNGSIWQAIATLPDLIFEAEFTATAGQTTYSPAGGYRVGFTYVWVNGVLLSDADITATDGVTITFASALSLNDEVRVMSFKAVGSVTAADVGAVAKAGDTMTGALGVVAGTNSAPGIFASGDTNTGIFFPAADTIAFTEGGVESMRINSSGNVGIGKTPDSGRGALQVNGGAEVLSINGGQLAGFRNKIINGKMEIAQRGTSTSGVTTAGYWAADRMGYNITSASAVVTISQQEDAPSNNEFQYSHRVAVTTADTSIAAGEIVAVQQIIEGFNARDLIGRTFTLSFWVRSSKTGTHCVAFTNGTPDRSYVAEYTINAANTWEYKTITVSGGLITAGTWNWTNGAGLRVYWTLAAGSTYQTTAGAWQTGWFIATSNQVNCVDSNTNIFALTGIQLEIGSVATPFEHRPYGTELALCQRYLPAITGADTHTVGMASVNSTTIVYIDCKFPVTARVRPTGITVGRQDFITVESGAASFVSSAIVVTAVQSVNNGLISVTVSGATQGRAGFAYFNGNAGSSASILFTGCEL